ncbi:tetratricopeptide repeat protein, partial [Candidatus Poribacteria bacterium]|nr:tetratricopeptide repeat protein [Candidatus Poribacteria bacterium]
PEYPDVSYYLGYCYYELGPQWANEAIPNFEEALKSKADYSLSHFYLGTLYYQSGAYKEALVHLNRVTGTPHDAHAKYVSGMSHWKLGRSSNTDSEKSEEYSKAKLDLIAAIQSESKPDRRKTYQDARKAVIDEEQKWREAFAKVVKVEINPVLASLYKSYDEIPIGTVTLRNPTKEPLYNAKLIVTVPEYMDASTVQILDNLPPRGQATVDVKVKFNEKIFDVTNNIENHPLSITLEYSDSTGRQTEKRDDIFFPIYNRNVTFWKPVESIASFISPQNPAVQEITRTYCNADNSLEKAIQIYDALQVYGMEYLQDPNDPYGEDIDTVYYPWETLKFKKGDCDDLSVLYASCLHNVGIDTALLLPEGHIYVMFNSGIAAERAKRVLPDEALYTVVNGTAWIPVEVTMLGKKDQRQKERTFFDAWSEGARIYQEGMERFFTKIAWQKYKTASSGASTVELSLPGPDLVKKMYNEDIRRAENHWITVFKGKAEEYQRRLGAPVVTNEATLRNLLGVTYVRMGEYQKAEQELQEAVLKAPSVARYHNNLANVLLLLGRQEEALAEYEKAIALDAQNVPIYFNLAIYHLMLQEEEKARNLIDKAKKVSGPDTVEMVAKVMGMDAGQIGPNHPSETRASGIGRSTVVAELVGVGVSFSRKAYA